MALISDTDLNQIMDHMAQFYVRANGVSGDSYGIGTYGTQVAATNLLNDFNGLNNIDAAVAIGDEIKALQTSPVSGFIRGQLGPLMTSLHQHIQSFSTAASTMDQYLAGLNASGAWAALQNPVWADLYPILNGNGSISRQNIWFEVSQGTIYPNGLGSLAYGGSFTSGETISSTFAGGFPGIYVTGLTGSGTVTVTGTALDPAGYTPESGKTWTAAVSADGTATLAPGGSAPASANSLILAATAISLGTGITAGSFYVVAQRPTGRLSLP